MIINGKNVASKKTFDVINPFTKDKVGTVPVATPEQIERALMLSYEKTPRLTANERARILRDVSERLKKNKKELSELITSESGLSIKDTMHEIDRVSKVAYFSSKIAEKIDNDTSNEYILELQKGKPKLKVITEPLDLVVGITPFNHPMNQVAHKVFPAVAAGTCIVLRPSSKTSLSAIKVGQLLLEAGLENNMLNIVTGVPADEIVEKMVTYPLLDLVSFTGGLITGVHIKNRMCASGNVLKKYVPELGGCSSLIIADDADIRKSVEVATQGCFANSGQRCTAVRRIVVLQSIAEEFVEAFVKETEKIKYGNPYDEEIDMGTVISEKAAKIIEKRVNDAIKDGARLRLGNVREGALYSPTVLDNVNIESELVTKETFGPVGAIVRTKNIDDAIHLANMTNYRLAGAVMTENRDIAHKISKALMVGQFNWNGPPGYRTEVAPFGGFKDSGNGEKEGVLLAAQGMRRIRTFYEH